MPQVPVSQGNRERLAPIANEKFDAADMSSVSRAFGQGLVGLGQAGAQAADAVDQIQDVYDEHDARQLDVEHAARAREIRRRVRQTHGIAAQPAALQADTELQELDRDILARARSRNARNMLEPLVQRRSSVERDGNIEYSDQQTTVAVDAGYSARIDTTLGEAEEQWQHPEVQEERLQTALGEITRRGEWRGADPATIAHEREEATSRIRSSVVTQLAQAERYDEAGAYLEVHHAEIDHDTEVGLRRLVNGGLRDLEDDRTANWAIGGEGESAPASPAPPAAAPVRSGGRRGAVALEGNNPGGINDGSFARGQPGYVGANGGYAAFRTMQDGVNAQKALLRSYVRRGYDTPMEIAHRWAPRDDPRGAHRNDPVAYAQNVARTMGIGVNETIGPAQIDRFANAQARQENHHFRPGMASQAGRPADGGGGGGDAATAAPGMIDVNRAIARIDGRTDLSPSARLRARDRVRQLANQQMTDRTRAEEEAGRQADEYMVEHGDSFTNPADVPGFSHLSPSRQANLADRARSNRSGESRPVTPELLQLYNYTRFANPQRFASPEFQRELITRGAPQTMLRQWGAESGQLMGQSAAQVAQRVGDDRLWQIAKPILREAGMDFDRADVDPAARGAARRELSAADRAADTHRKNLMLTRLREFSQIWAQAHPGQVPDDAVMRGWVGNLLLGVNGQRSFEADDQTIFIQLAGTPMGREIAANLGRRNVAPTPQNVVAAYRRLLALQSAPRQ